LIVYRSTISFKRTGAACESGPAAGGGDPRQTETNIRRKAAEIFDNRFAEDLKKSGFLKEIWGGKVP
jgi:hypothetical protein